VGRGTRGAYWEHKPMVGRVKVVLGGMIIGDVMSKRIRE